MKKMTEADKLNQNRDSRSYQSSSMQKSVVIELLRQKGFRITKQRKLLIDIILGETYSCCKEVYILASRKDPGIGIATVYRTMDALEQVGALKRRTAYHLCDQVGQIGRRYQVQMEDGSVRELDDHLMKRVVACGMEACGLSDMKQVKEILLLKED